MFLEKNQFIYKILNIDSMHFVYFRMLGTHVSCICERCMKLFPLGLTTVHIR